MNIYFFSRRIFVYFCQKKGLFFWLLLNLGKEHSVYYIQEDSAYD